MDEKNNPNNKATKSFSLKDIVTLISIVGGFYTALSALKLFTYQKSCEVFYGIPGKYFTVGILEYIFRICVIVGVLYLFFYANHNVHNIDKENYAIFERLSNILTVFCVSVIIGLLNIDYSLIVIKTFHRLFGVGITVYNFLQQIYGLYGMVLLAITLLTFFLVVYAKNNSIKYKVAVVFATFHISIMIIAVLCIIFSDPYSKTEYEFINIEGEEYVILSEYHDKLLVAEYKEEYDDSYEFYTGSYCLKEDIPGERTYKSVKSLKINKSDLDSK